MYITTTGLILRETIYKESSKILTVLTSAKGKITVTAKGVRRRGSKMAAPCQLLACSEMTLFNGKGRYVLTEARSLELFEKLRDDITALSLGMYFAELLDTLCGEETPEPEMMSLGLNSLFALTEEKYPQRLVKAVFEMRLMSLAGFAPATDACGVCGKANMEAPVFGIEAGTVFCSGCRKVERGRTAVMQQGTLDALRYIISAPPKRIFSFRIGDEALKSLSYICEEYVKTHLDREFKTLDFYKSVSIS